MNKQLQPVLEVENVSKAFGGVEALKKGSMKLFPGEVLAIVGANGAGKSTLIKIIAGVLNPDQGQMSIKGNPVARQDHQQASSHFDSGRHLLGDQGASADNGRLRQLGHNRREAVLQATQIILKPLQAGYTQKPWYKE